jgi:hypothetical protein
MMLRWVFALEVKGLGWLGEERHCRDRKQDVYVG